MKYLAVSLSRNCPANVSRIGTATKSLDIRRSFRHCKQQRNLIKKKKNLKNKNKQNLIQIPASSVKQVTDAENGPAPIRVTASIRIRYAEWADNPVNVA